jgi:hypothetical protein
MDDKVTAESVLPLVAKLSPQEQLELAAYVARLTGAQTPGAPVQTPLPDLQRMEAEWVSRELDEFVKLIQQYRNLYVTAIFAALGWALGQVLSSPPTTLQALRSRQDVAAVLSAIPLINVLFSLLMLEAYAHVGNLARYRFILGLELGRGSPPWRWDLWRDTPGTSVVRSATSALNVFSVIVFLVFTGGALWFAFPAVRTTGWLWVLWGPALLAFLGLLAAALIVGIFRSRSRLSVTRPPSAQEQWRGLWLPTGDEVRPLVRPPGCKTN